VMLRYNIQIDTFSRLLDFWWLWPIYTEFVHPLLRAVSRTNIFAVETSRYVQGITG
jgi:hypothetical protein